MVRVDPYSIVFLAMAVFFFLVRSVLRLRTGSERSLVTDAFFYRLSMIAAVLGAMLYVADKAQWHSRLEAALTPVAAPTIAATTESAPVADSVPIYPTNNGTSAMIDVALGVQPLRMLLDTGATTCLVSEAIAARIVRDGYGVRQETIRFTMADGTIRTLPSLLISEVQIVRLPSGTAGPAVQPTGALYQPCPPS